MLTQDSRSSIEILNAEIFYEDFKRQPTILENFQLGGSFALAQFKCIFPTDNLNYVLTGFVSFCAIGYKLLRLQFLTSH